MASVWVEGPSVNAVPYRLFITKGKPKILAAIVFADDKHFYFVFSKEVRSVANDIILASPFVDRTKVRYLVFTYNKRRIKTTGYLIKTTSKYEFDIFTEEVRYIIAATIDKPVKVRKLKSEEELPKTAKKLGEEEKVIFELAPIDIPSEVEEEIVKQAAEAIELADEEIEASASEEEKKTS